eukprot:s127_g2.t2
MGRPQRWPTKEVREAPFFFAPGAHLPAPRCGLLIRLMQSRQLPLHCKQLWALSSFVQAAEADAEPSTAAGRAGKKCVGIVLALLAGALTGVQSVPAALYNQKYSQAPATDVVFPQCLGIYVCSSAIYLLYAGVSKVAGWRVPHSAIRPAYASGCIWAVGFAFMITGIADLGFSVGYTLDAVGPIAIASLLSIFVFQEITDKWQLMLYGVAFALQLLGVVLMSAAGSKHDS